MTRTIENDCLRVTVDDHGAELVSVYDKEKQCERIWCADPAVWNRHAPILFPFVGKVAGGTYRYEEQEYEMKTQHGFARDREFEYISNMGFVAGKDDTVSEQTSDTAKHPESALDTVLTHRLVSDGASLVIYPFPFELTVTHRLAPGHSRVLQVEWNMKNCGTGEMYYSIGGHPGFAVPTASGWKREDMWLEFPEHKKENGNENLTYLLIDANGLAVTDQKYTLATDDGFCRITSDFFDRDALIFEDMQINCVRLAAPDRAPYVTLYCPGFPYVGIWSKPEGEFVCLEPWVGRTDDVGFAGTLQEKTGESALAAGETAEYGYMMEFH